MRSAFIYIMSNRPNGTLYTGATSDLHRRISEHKAGTGSVLVCKYGLRRLVYSEKHADIRSAIQRETSIKRWPRAWKVRLIVAGNPDWEDLAGHW